MKKEEIKSDNLTLQVMEKPDCKIELTVKANAFFVKKVQKKAIKEVGKKISIPGFRPGKAPEEMILKQYSSHVDEKLRKLLADETFKEAAGIAKIPILSDGPSITFDLKSLDLQKGATLIFKFEKEPHIPTIDPTTYTQKKSIKKSKITQKEIDEAVRQTRFFYAEWTPIKNRAVKEKDFIILDLETVEKTPQKVFHETRFEVSDEKMAQWMKKLVIGMKTGEVKEGISEPDETEKKASKEKIKPKKVKLTLKKIEKAKLPELNDDFAKKVGAKDISHFEKSVTEMLEKKAEEKFDKELRENINEFLLKNYSFDLPISLIEKEKKHRIQQMLASKQAQDQYASLSNEEKEKLEKKLTKEAEDAVRLFYLSRKILNDAKIEVTSSDIYQEVVDSMRAYGSVQVDPKSIPKEAYALAFSKVMLRKAQDHILENSEKQT